MENNNRVSALKVEFIAPTEFVEHPQHKAFFLEPAKKKKTESYHDSLFKFGKVKPVIYIEKDGQKLVIDGWSYVIYALSNSFSEVAASQLDLTDDEDIAQIMLELQFSDHSTVEEEYKIYKAAYELFSKGKGQRNDLNELEKETDGKKRRPDIHERIAAMTNASSGKRVQYILKIGSINPTYLKRMDVEKMSAYRAYENCKKEEKGIKPIKREAKKITEESEPNDITQSKPPFPTKEELIHSFDKIVAQAMKEKKITVVNKPELNVTEDENCYWILSKCPNCNSPVKVVLPKLVFQNS